MKLQDQVISLELARKLKKLGVKQYSSWYWVFDEIRVVNGRNEAIEPYLASKEKVDRLDKQQAIFDYCSAFTVAELGEMLPSQFEVKKPKKGCGKLYFQKQWKDENKEGIFNLTDFGEKIWRIQYETLYDPEEYEEVDIISAGLGKTEANIRAKMLIYLIENGLIKL